MAQLSCASLSWTKATNEIEAMLSGNSFHSVTVFEKHEYFKMFSARVCSSRCRYLLMGTRNKRALEDRLEGTSSSRVTRRLLTFGSTSPAAEELLLSLTGKSRLGRDSTIGSSFVGQAEAESSLRDTAATNRPTRQRSVRSSRAKCKCKAFESAFHFRFGRKGHGSRCRRSRRT